MYDLYQSGGFAIASNGYGTIGSSTQLPSNLSEKQSKTIEDKFWLLSGAEFIDFHQALNDDWGDGSGYENYCWLRSPYADNNDGVWSIYVQGIGGMDSWPGGPVTGCQIVRNLSYTYDLRPVFQLELA